jgi:hypothetical protein
MGPFPKRPQPAGDERCGSCNFLQPKWRISGPTHRVDKAEASFG